MKRIYNSIPLASVMFFVGGLQKVRIIDYDRMSRHYLYPGKEVYAGLAASARSYLEYKHEYAAVIGIDATDDVLTIEICSEE